MKRAKDVTMIAIATYCQCGISLLPGCDERRAEGVAFRPPVLSFLIFLSAINMQ